MSPATAAAADVGAEPARASRDSVDVWVVPLDSREGDEDLRTLSASERELGARLRVGAGAWMAARAALRRVLGRYLGLAPARVTIETGANGKPRLAPDGGIDLRFNLSHSGNMALIAIRLGFDVGVDIEALRPGVDAAAISRDVFTAPERVAMAALAAEEPVETFFRSWVRREALAKVTGLGIVTAPAPHEAARYTVCDLDGIPGFAAALASEGATWSVRRIAPRG